MRQKTLLLETTKGLMSITLQSVIKLLHQQLLY